MQSKCKILPLKPVLFIFGGLPACGKTSVARELAGKIAVCHLRIDTLEQASLRTGAVAGGEEIAGKGYEIMCELAKDQLKNGLSVIADCVNPLELTRDWWRLAAAEVDCPAVEVEFICSSPALHRERAECRKSDIPGLALPDWEAIQSRHYEAWEMPHLILDTAVMSAAEAAEKIIDYTDSKVSGFIPREIHTEQKKHF